MRKYTQRFAVFALAAITLPVLAAQSNSKPAGAAPPPTAAAQAKSPISTPATIAPVPGSKVASPAFDQWDTKSFDVKYVDPEQLREIFSGRSFVMEANRDLKTLTAHGTPAFLKEVEETIKRFDVPPPAPADFQVTVYLLTVAAQAPAGLALPAELASLGKEVTGSGAQALRLADSQMMRLREGQTGEVTGGPGAADAAMLTRIRLRSAFTIPGNKGDLISLDGLQVWLNIPAVAGATAPTGGKADADVSADIDVQPNQPVVISKVGVDKPIAVVVRVSLAR